MIHPANLFRTKQRQPTSILDRLGTDFHSLFSGYWYIGITGSGKTSTMRPLIREILPYVGCCWAAVKVSEIEDSIRVCREAGREPKLLSKQRLNVLSYMLNAPGGSPMEVTRYLERLNQSLHASKGDGESAFWENLFTRGLTFAITICHLAKRDKVTLDNVHRFVSTAPNSAAALKEQKEQNSFFFQMLTAANGDIQSDDEYRLLDQAFSFFTKEYLTLGTKAQSAMQTQISGVLGPLLVPPFFNLFCSEASTFTPDDVLAGECIILDFPILRWGDGGKFAQQLFLQMTKSALLNQATPGTPVLFVQDEFQLLTSPEFDVNFSTVARSSRAIKISATQSISVLTSLLGGDPRAAEQCRALMSCHATHVVLATNDSETANYYSSLWGEHRELFHSFSDNRQAEPDDLISSIFGGQLNVQNTETIRPRVTIDHLLQLRTGSPEHDYLIDAYVTQGGKLFSDTGLPYRMVTFSSLE